VDVDCQHWISISKLCDFTLQHALQHASIQCIRIVYALYKQCIRIAACFTSFVCTSKAFITSFYIHCAAFRTHRGMCVNVHKCVLNVYNWLSNDIFLHYVHRCKRHFFSLKVLTTNLLKFSFFYITLLGSFYEAWKC